MDNNTKVLQEIVVNKISRPLRSEKGYSDISTTKEISFNKENILSYENY